MKTAQGLDPAEMLKEIVGIRKVPMSVLCVVDSVDEDTKTCAATPIYEGPQFLDILLMAETSTTGFYLKPAIGSLIMIAPQDENTYYVSMYSDIDEVWIRGNTNGGVIKVNDLVNKINTLENLVNSILNTLKSTTIPLAPSGTYPFAPLYTSLSDISPITSADDIQSSTVLHG